MLSLQQRATLLRVERKKKLAEKRLRPLHGDGWEIMYKAELKRESALSLLQMQISVMDPREIAEWIYELKEK